MPGFRFMKSRADSHANALSQQLTDLFFRCQGNFTNIRTFRKVALAGLPAASVQIHKQYSEFPAFLDSSGWHFSDREMALSPEFRREFADTMSKQLKLNAQAAIDAASLVLAHSVLDDAASEGCRISSRAEPNDWRTAIEGKKVTLRCIKETAVEDVYAQYLREHIEQLQKEPLMKRLELLNQKCQPVPSLTIYRKPYNYDPGRVKALDNMRHEVIHRVEITKNFPTIESDLEFLENTCRFVVWLLMQHHRIPLSAQDWIGRRSGTQGHDGKMS